MQLYEATGDSILEGAPSQEQMAVDAYEPIAICRLDAWRAGNHDIIGFGDDYALPY